MINCQWRRKKKKYSFCGVCSILKNPRVFRVGLRCPWAAVSGLCHLHGKNFFLRFGWSFLSFSKWPKRFIQPLQPPNLQGIVRMSFFLGKNLFVGSTTWEKEKHEALHVLKNCFPPCRRVFLCCAWEESLQPRCCRGRTTGQARKGKWGREVKVLLVFHSPFASGLLPLPLSPCQTFLFFEESQNP